MASRKSKKHLKLNYVFATIVALTGSSLITEVQSSTVRSDIDYQYFRDYGENKGQFRIGASNIKIIDKNGKFIGTMMENHKMLDLGSLSATGGFTTLVGSQNLVSVKHNGGYQAVQFRAFTRSRDQHAYEYYLTNRNEFPLTWDNSNINDKDNHPDYHYPRIHKLVTEVAPAPVSEEFNTSLVEAEYMKNHEVFASGVYSMFARAGSGSQRQEDEIGEGSTYKDARGRPITKRATVIAGAYEYLTGGAPMEPYWAKKPFHIVGNGSFCILEDGRVVNKKNDNTGAFFCNTKSGPMTSYGEPGDSGSAVWGYNTKTQRWEVLGVLVFNYERIFINDWGAVRPAFHRQIEHLQIAGKIENNVADSIWTWSSETNEASTSTISLNGVDVNTINTDGNNKIWRNDRDSVVKLSTWNTNNFTLSTQQVVRTDANTGEETIDTEAPITPTSLQVNLYNASHTVNKVNHPGEDYGKSIIFTGTSKGKLVLANSINQGAGALYFKNDFDVSTDPNATTPITWMGAGIDIDEGKTVTWSVANPENDRLSKIGKGTLVWQGTGVNNGEISIGDGLVILKQQADSNNRVQAFKRIGITSGRPTLRLEGENQFNPNNLSFEYRGGRLDLNGYNFSTLRIANVDDGGTIINSNTEKASTITLGDASKYNYLVGYYSNQDKDLYQKWIGDIAYYYVGKGSLNDRENRYKANTGKNGAPPLPDGGYDTEYFKFIGNSINSGKVDAINNITNFDTFSGHIGERGTENNQPWAPIVNPEQKATGILNVNINPSNQNATLVFNGGMNVTGNVTVTNGTLVLSGMPSPHARDYFNNTDVVFDYDWLNRDFAAQNINITNNATLTSSRNVASITANFNANQTATINLGYKDGDMVCYRNEWAGDTVCKNDALSDKAKAENMVRTQVRGVINLQDQASLSLGQVDFVGSINATNGTAVTLNKDAVWKLTKNSTVGNITLSRGSVLIFGERDLNITKTKTISTDEANDQDNDQASNQATTNNEDSQAGNNADAETVTPVATNGVTLASVSLASEETTGATDEEVSEVKGNHRSLTVENFTADNAIIGFRSDLSQLSNDKIIINKNASGNITFDLENYNTGTETNLGNRRIELIKLAGDDSSAEIDGEEGTAGTEGTENQDKPGKLVVNFVNQHIDLGAYRVRLAADNGAVYLEDPNRQENVAQPEEPSTNESEISEPETDESDTSEPKTNESETEQPEKTDGTNNNEEPGNNGGITTPETSEVTPINPNDNNGNSDISHDLSHETTNNQNSSDQTSSDTSTKPTKPTKPTETQVDQSKNNKTSVTTLPQKEIISRYSNAALTDLVGQMVVLRELDAGLASSLISQQNVGEAYLNYKRLNNSHFSANYRDFTQKLSIFQVGGQTAYNEGGMSFGVQFSQVNSENEFSGYDENFHGSTEVNALNLQATKKFASDTYLAVDAGYALVESSISMPKETASFKRGVTTLGFNAVQKFEVAGLKVDLLAGVVHHHFSAVKYTLDGANVNSKAFNTLGYQTGINFSKTWKLGKVSITPKVAYFYADLFNKNLNQKIEVNKHAMNLNFNHKTSYEVGVKVKVENLSVAVNFGESKAKDTKTTRKIDVQFAVSF